MTLWEFVIRAQSHLPLTEVSRAERALPFYVWGLGRRAWILSPTDSSEVSDRLRYRLENVGVHVLEAAEAAHARIFLVADDIPSQVGLRPLFQRFGCEVSPPWMFLDGWGYFRAMSFGEIDLRGLLRTLREHGSASLIRKVHLPLEALSIPVWIHELFSDLTRRQIECLSLAFREGYYESPRNVTTVDLARKSAVSRSTFEEHFRAAENGLMNAILSRALTQAPMLAGFLESGREGRPPQDPLGLLKRRSDRRSNARIALDARPRQRHPLAPTADVVLAEKPLAAGPAA
ncbi:MAG TPA: helix-turn-helix domain-containing protein [Thermoplasmata archaeon]|nr:helix-turn-helix domain-containing protein [Thermoplasmata archaeon]